MGGPTNLLNFFRLRRGRAIESLMARALAVPSEVNQAPPRPDSPAYLLL
jgi:hypothetical protein